MTWSRICGYCNPSEADLDLYGFSPLSTQNPWVLFWVPMNQQVLLMGIVNDVVIVAIGCRPMLR
jgi:hypothetical protein